MKNIATAVIVISFMFSIPLWLIGAFVVVHFVSHFQ